MIHATELAMLWYRQKGELKQKFATLTDSDLFFESGKKEEMLDRLEAKLGKTREELNKIFAAL